MIGRFRLIANGTWAYLYNCCEIGIIDKTEDGWQAWLTRPYPQANMKLGTFPTRREAADEIDVERSSGEYV